MEFFFDLGTLLMFLFFFFFRTPLGIGLRPLG
jgi:hypothetical protein